MEILKNYKSQLDEFVIKKNAVYFPYSKALPAETIVDIVKQYFGEM